MELREFFSEDAVKLDLEGTSKDEILKELIGLLGLDDKAEGMLEGVQLAELGLQSWAERRWVDVPKLG